jgi:hypothetical protein
VLTVGGQERERIVDAHLLLQPHVEQAHALAVAARADAHERDAVAMARVHVRLDLEHEAGEFFFPRIDDASIGLARQRARCVADERGQQLRDAEIIDGRAEEHRRLPAREIRFQGELRRGAAHQVDFIAISLRAVAQQFRGRLAVQAIDGIDRSGAALLGRLVDVDAIF